MQQRELVQTGETPRSQELGSAPPPRTMAKGDAHGVSSAGGRDPVREGPVGVIPPSEDACSRQRAGEIRDVSLKKHPRFRELAVRQKREYAVR